MDHIHTRIDNPMHLRKNLLESAIDVTGMMESVEEIKKRIEDGNMLRNELRNKMNKFVNEADVLLKTLPPIPDDLEKKFSKKSKLDAVPSANILERPKLSEIFTDRKALEMELERIRKRMDSIHL